MEKLFTFLATHWDTIATIGTAIALVIARFTSAWPYVLKVFSYVKLYATAPVAFARGLARIEASTRSEAQARQEALARLEAKVDTIEKEVKTNGGSTIKDATLRLEDASFLMQAKMNLLFNRTDTAHIEIDPVSGDLIFANDAACSLFAGSLDHMLLRGWVRFIHPEDQTEVWAKLRRCLEQDLPYAARLRLINPSTGVQVRVVDMSVIQLKSPRSGKTLSAWGDLKLVE